MKTALLSHKEKEVETLTESINATLQKKSSDSAESGLSAEAASLTKENLDLKKEVCANIPV